MSDKQYVIVVRIKGTRQGVMSFSNNVNQRIKRLKDDITKQQEDRFAIFKNVPSGMIEFVVAPVSRSIEWA
jgi:hypothetical protein